MNACKPAAVLKIVMDVALELLQTTLSRQSPGDTEELMTAVIPVSESMLHATTGRSQTKAVQLCDSETKFVPTMVIVAPA